MSIFIKIAFLTLAAITWAFGQPSALNPEEFNAGLKSTDNFVLIDVRTPEEFTKGYIEGAVNISSNDPSFESKFERYNKTSPVFLYCLSGGRSSSVAKKLNKMGFTQIIDLKGGILKWKAANLPVFTSRGVSDLTGGMSSIDYDKLVKENNIILVDFFAEWCAPCKKMKPLIDEISKETEGNVKVIRIDADANPSLVKSQNIDALPVILIYKKGTKTWSHTGFATKNEIIAHLK